MRLTCFPANSCGENHRRTRVSLGLQVERCPIGAAAKGPRHGGLPAAGCCQLGQDHLRTGACSAWHGGTRPIGDDPEPDSPVQACNVGATARAEGWHVVRRDNPGALQGVTRPGFPQRSIVGEHDLHIRGAVRIPPVEGVVEQDRSRELRERWTGLAWPRKAVLGSRCQRREDEQPDRKTKELP